MYKTAGDRTRLMNGPTNGGRPARRVIPYGIGGIEPPLEELLQDPITQTLMDRDHVRSQDLLSLIETTRSGLKAGGR